MANVSASCLIKIIKLALIILALSVYFLLTAIIHTLTFLLLPNARLRLISMLNQCVAVILKGILNVHTVINGDRSVLKERGNLIISNHLGYCDGIVLGSLCKVVYVSKREVKSWPIFGIMALLGATIFIDRKRKDRTLQYIDTIAQSLKNGLNILLFPEGTSTNGERLRSFQAPFFASPISAGCDILPITISYTSINGRKLSLSNRDNVFWYGQIPFFHHLWIMLDLKRIEVNIKLHPKIKSSLYPNTTQGRHNLAHAAYALIAKEYPLSHYLYPVRNPISNGVDLA